MNFNIQVERGVRTKVFRVIDAKEGGQWCCGMVGDLGGFVLELMPES